MFLKILFLLTYFLLVFIGARLFEFYVTSVTGWRSFNDIFPTLFDDLWQQKYDGRDENSSCNCNYSDENRESEKEQLSCSNFCSEEAGIDDAKKFSIVDFASYGEFEENVEDTKACIWVVLVKNKRNSILDKREWIWISQRLHQFGIKLGTYQCTMDPRLCIQRKIYSSAVVLALPKGSQPKGSMAFHIFRKESIAENIEPKRVIFNWIKTKLYPKVKTVHSLSELTERPIPRVKHMLSKPSIFFIYQSDKRVPPLLLTTLSVKFTGRIKFYMFRTKETTSKLVNVFAMSPNIMYDYGRNKGEYFNYSCVEFFLRTLHPEVNDIFIISVILINMACWLELFLQKGGPLKRLLYYFWGFVIANIFLVSIWLLLIKLLYMPEAQPILELCLRKFQQVMFTNIAAIIRQDVIQLSKHLHVVLFGFVGYGILVGYLHNRMRRNTDTNYPSSILDIIHHDIEEVTQLFHSALASITPSLRIYIFEERIERILNRLAVPDLWLHSKCTTDYVHDLPTWTYCNGADCHCEVPESTSDDDAFSDCECSPPLSDNEDSKMEKYLPNQLLSNDCVICLDLYNCGDAMRGLPCGHCFHKDCIDSWLFPSHGITHRQCPVCRWPADIKKSKIEVIDFT